MLRYLEYPVICVLLSGQNHQKTVWRSAFL